MPAHLLFREDLWQMGLLMFSPSGDNDSIDDFPACAFLPKDTKSLETALSEVRT